MITQQDVHNHIVLNANDWQKRYLSMQCGNDVEKLKEVIPEMTEFDKGYILGKTEKMAKESKNEDLERKG